MPALIRRPSDDPHREGWNVYYGDVQVGHIGRRAGVPVTAPQWSWSCGFYPGMEPGMHRTGIAEGFEAARAGFEKDWACIVPTLTEADFEECRRNRAFHRLEISDVGLRLPPPDARAERPVALFLWCRHRLGYAGPTRCHRSHGPINPRTFG